MVIRRAALYRPLFERTRCTAARTSVSLTIRGENMSLIDAFVGRTLKWFLIVFGLATCGTLPFAIDIKLITPLLGGLVDYTPSSVPALRHWGIMIFGIGVLMIVAGFRPWLRFETMLFSAVEKAFLVYLYLSNLGQSWTTGYFAAFALDSVIVAYSIVYFISEKGRPYRWIREDETLVPRRAQEQKQR